MRGEFRRGPVVQTAVRSFFIVLVAPGFHHRLGMAAIDEDVHVQALVSELVVETLDERVWMCNQLHVIETLNREPSE